jgi:hypothetical protein
MIMVAHFGGAKNSGCHGAGGEEVALKAMERRASVISLMQGAFFGPDYQYQAGAGLRNLLDYREGQQHLPHPIILALMPIRLQSAAVAWKGNGGWVPSSLSKPQTMGVDHPLHSWLVYSHQTYFKDTLGAKFVVQFADRVERVCDNREFFLSVGDTASIKYDENTAYCTLDNIVVVHVGTDRYVWLSPRWFDVKQWVGRKDNDAPERHPVRKTILVKRRLKDDKAAYFAPVPVSDLLLHVGIVHSCVRTLGAGRQSEAYLCQAAPACKMHQDHECKDCGNTARWVVQDCHSKKNEIFEVMDRAAGFVTSKTCRVPL